MIDLRSDTVTRPTQGMMEAMMNASVGDDVYREDPSVNELEAYTAELTGMEASIFMPTGCMANLTALYISGGRGNEVLCHPMSHIMQYELASPASIAQVMLVQVPGDRGLLNAASLEPYIKEKELLGSYPTLISLENSANRAGGSCYSLEQIKEISSLARSREILVHMDGARSANAALARGYSLKEMCQYTDSLTLCLSKGLGAPVGSMLCGSASFINQARRVRKLLGGGMRQAGYLAAAGLYALKHHMDRLEDDHRHAQIIAQAAAQSSSLDINLDEVETNIIKVSTGNIPTSEIIRRLSAQGIAANPMGRNAVRFVTHLDISSEDAERAARIIKSL